MGNSVGSGGLLSNVGDKGPYSVQLGKHAAIVLSTRQNREQNGGFSDVWTMSYAVDVSTCMLQLTRQHGKGLLLEVSGREPSKGDGNTLSYYYRSDIQAVHITDVLIHNNRIDINGRISFNRSKQIQAGGHVTETEVYLYGAKHKGGLIVMEKKKESEDKLPYMVTLAHYYATSAGINNVDKVDFGLSVVAKIRASNGKFDIKVEGPEQHPASALIYLFQEVGRTGIWKPTICPHCARNRRLQDDSEDSDSGSVKSRHCTRQNPRSLANDGAFVGDGNGNFFERNVFVWGQSP